MLPLLGWISVLAPLLDGINLLGIFDPISLFFRFIITIIYPSIDVTSDLFPADNIHFLGSWIIGGFFMFLLIANLKEPRWWCRKLCPLSALLGILAKFSIFRIKNKQAIPCKDCQHCQAACEGNANPGKEDYQVSECFVCLNCLDTCRSNTITYGKHFLINNFNSSHSTSRRGFIGSILLGTGTAVAIGTSTNLLIKDKHNLIRPPGSIAEDRFLDKCIRCGLCLKVCPTNVLQFTWDQAGIEGLWTPYLDFNSGYCQLDCVACSEVCPTGAIADIIPAQRRSNYKSSKRIKLGTAFFNKNTCIQFNKDAFNVTKACLYCQDVCPVSPKAIETVTDVNGWQIPYVDQSLCIGCGTCEYKCPLDKNNKGIYVTNKDETRL